MYQENYYKKGGIIIKSKLIKVKKKIADTVVGGYNSIENNITNGFKKISDSVVDKYTQIEDSFVDKYLTKDGETIEEAKIRLKNVENLRRI
ncbi:MAG: hypothetical protein ACK5HP_02495 [Bacilli bacterium]